MTGWKCRPRWHILQSIVSGIYLKAIKSKFKKLQRQVNIDPLRIFHTAKNFSQAGDGSIIRQENPSFENIKHLLGCFHSALKSCDNGITILQYWYKKVSDYPMTQRCMLRRRGAWRIKRQMQPYVNIPKSGHELERDIDTINRSAKERHLSRRFG